MITVPGAPRRLPRQRGRQIAAALREAAQMWAVRHEAGELRDVLLAIVGRLSDPS